MAKFLMKTEMGYVYQREDGTTFVIPIQAGARRQAAPGMRPQRPGGRAAGPPAVPPGYDVAARRRALPAPGSIGGLVNDNDPPPTPPPEPPSLPAQAENGYAKAPGYGVPKGERGMMDIPAPGGTDGTVDDLDKTVIPMGMETSYDPRDGASAGRWFGDREKQQRRKLEELIRNGLGMF